MCVREDSDQIHQKQFLKVTSKVRSEGEESFQSAQPYKDIQ